MITRRQALALGSPCVVVLVGCAVAELGLRIIHRIRPFGR